MKVVTLSTAVLIAFLNNMGFADHETGIYRRLDDLAFGASAATRDLRWKIHDDFVSSGDYRFLLRDADRLALNVQDVIRAIWAERPDQMICREIEGTRNSLNALADRLEASDFAMISEGCYRPISAGKGYAFAPPTRHAGYGHVIQIRQMLASIDSSLCAMHNELTGGQLVPLNALPVPNAPVIPNPSGPAHPPGSPHWSGPQVVPGMNVPRSRGTGVSGRNRDVPLFEGRSGGLVLKHDR